VPAQPAYNVGMARRAADKQYTIRFVPVALDRLLRERARREGKSLNQVALDALRRGLGADAPVVHHDLDRYSGTWIEEAEVDAALAEQRAVDDELWR
jgi:hypothetical protein